MLVRIADDVKISPGCWFGNEGFGYTRDENNVPVFQVHLGGVVIESGVEIAAGVIIDMAIGKDEVTIIRENTKIGAHVHIGHNCDIGPANLIAPGTVFGGSVKTGGFNFFGLSSTIKHGITIGQYNMIGMSAAVIRDIGNHEVWAGNPARFIRENTMFK